MFILCIYNFKYKRVSMHETTGTHQQYLEDLLRSHTTLFVEEQLSQYFGPLISFVKKAEAVLKQPDGSFAINSEGAGAALVAAGTSRGSELKRQ